MARKIALGAVLPLLAMMFAVPALAKAPTAKVTVSGPGITQPIELTDKDALSANVWGGNFLDRQAGVVAAPSPDLPQYTVQFHVKLDEGVRMMYVVYYVWDATSGHALVQIPGTEDQWYKLNVSTISRCCQGKWFYASQSWGEAIRAALPAKR